MTFLTGVSLSRFPPGATRSTDMSIDWLCFQTIPTRNVIDHRQRMVESNLISMADGVPFLLWSSAVFRAFLLFLHKGQVRERVRFLFQERERAVGCGTEKVVEMASIPVIILERVVVDFYLYILYEVGLWPELLVSPKRSWTSWSFFSVSFELVERERGAHAPN